jgi:hypothetical protein
MDLNNLRNVWRTSSIVLINVCVLDLLIVTTIPCPDHFFSNFSWHLLIFGSCSGDINVQLIVRRFSILRDARNIVKKCKMLMTVIKHLFSSYPFLLKRRYQNPVSCVSGVKTRKLPVFVFPFFCDQCKKRGYGSRL